MSVNSQTKKVAMVVNVPNGMDAAIAERKLHEFVATYCANWFLVKHDKDANAEGELKTLHWHLLFQSNDGKMHRILWYLNRIADSFGVESLTPFSAVIWKNYESDIQYLIHKNNPERYQYSKEEVEAYDTDEFEKVLTLEVTATLTIDRIASVCQECGSLIEVYRSLGLGVSQMYRALIVDIWKSTKGVRK